MTQAQFLSSPAVSIIEDDQSDFPVGLSASSAAIVAPFKRGPSEAIVTTIDEFLELFEISTDWTLAAYDALHYLEEGNKLTVLRVSKSAKHAGLTVLNNGFSAFDDAPVSSVMEFPNGSFADYQTGARQLITGAISGTFVSGNSTLITLNDGTNTYTATVGFVADHNTTVRAIIDAINALINTGISATVSPGGASAAAIGGSSLNLIRVMSPSGKTFTLTLATTGGVSQPTYVYSNDASAQFKLFDVFAQNPGAHGNDIGLKFTSIRQATAKQLTLTFSADFVSLNNVAFNLTYKGQVTSVSETWATSHSAMMSAIGAKIQALIGVAGSVLVNATARTIKILSPELGVDNLSVTTPLVTLGASQATCVVTTAAAVDNDDTFNIEIYTRTNQVTPKKTYTVSLRKIVDGFGNSLYIEDVINRSADKSRDIRVDHYLLNPLGKLVGLDTGTIYFLNGGNNGTLPSSSDIAAGWNLLKDRVLYPDVRILINAGHADITVHAKMIEVAEKRTNSFAVLDMPSASQGASDAVTYRNTTLNANSSFGMIVTNDVEIADPFTQSQFYVSPSGKAAAAMARTLNISAHLSPAGLNRGQVRGVVGVRNLYSEGDRNSLAAAQINPILNMQGGFGFVLWDALTLQKKTSVMSYVSSRMNMIVIRDACERFFPFLLQEAINANLFFRVEQFGRNLLDPMVGSGALKAAKIVCDETNNKPSDEDAGRVNIKIFLDFPRPARSIVLTLIPTRAGGISVTEQFV